MAKVKKALTEAAVKRFRPAPPGQRDEHYDRLTPGLALRVTDKGAKSWALMYRVRGDKKARRMTLGSYDVLSLSEAREQARAALLQAKSGSDPKIVHEGTKDAQATDTFERAAKLFIAEHIEKKLGKRTQVEYIRPIEQVFIPRWGNRAVQDITRNDIRGIRDDIAKKRGPVAANRALAVISKFFNFCLDENMIEASPAVRIAHAVKEEPRERTLSDKELAAIWYAAGRIAGANDRTGYPYGPLIRLLILTGQRRSEVGGMCWSEIDECIWTIPRDRMKTKRSHAVPLSPLALKIITDVPRQIDVDLLFSPTGRAPLSGYARAKIALDKLSGVSDWTFHDIRRSVVTGMRRDLKIDRAIVGAVVGHTAPGITAQVYDQYDQLDEKRGALNAWARKIGALDASAWGPAGDVTVMGPATNVVQIKQ